LGNKRKKGFYMKTGRRLGIFTAALICAAGLLPLTVHSALVCAKNGNPAAEIVIPLKSVNLSIEQNNKVRALFYTQIAPRSTKEHSINTAWCGGRVHSVSSFGELVFDLE
ncbi:MAG: hypothetical protein IKO93_01895, partial [Lentisphaeria bacterium]|nr:hypothetical protein [Lentisphaeria bacterium]